jgi:hypothetical protein
MLTPKRAPAPDQLKPLVVMKKQAGLIFFTPEQRRSPTNKKL